MSRVRPGHELCSPGSLLLLLLASLALAFLLVLAGLDAPGRFWQSLGLHGLFVFLVVLTAAGIFCRAGRSRHCDDLGDGGWLLFGLIQVVVLVYSIAVVAADDWLRPMELRAHDEPVLFVLRNLGISVIVSTVLARYLALHARWKRQVQAEAEARMRSLQARIHPHFLFNALNTISSLIHDQPGNAEQATLDLSDLLRSGLNDSTRHALGDELDLIRGYLRIEKLRLGDRLKVDWQLADNLPLGQELPALLIQPLVENAVIHGIARLPSGGTLRITGEPLRRKRIRFVIENPIPDDDADDEKPGNRIALDNIRQRLELAYEEGGRLKTSLDKGSFRVELVVPVSD